MAISTLPPAPARTDGADVFIAKADALIAALGQFVTEVNAAAVAFNNNSTNAVSTSSVTVGTGSKSFTADISKSYVPGQTVKVAYSSVPSNWMIGDVVSYNSSTGALVVSVVSTSGSGTYSTWTISLAPFTYTTSDFMKTVLDDADAAAARGTLGLNGAMLRAHKTVTQSLTSNVATKISFDTEIFDLSAFFATDRFFPTVAGYYIIAAGVLCQGTAITEALIDVYKGASPSASTQYQRGNHILLTSGNLSTYCAYVTGLIYLNGTTDFLEIYSRIVGTSPSITSAFLSVAFARN